MGIRLLYLKEMLRHLLILISVWGPLLSYASQNKKQPIMLWAQKMVMNEVVDQFIYEDNVRVEFENYYLLTSKIIFNLSKNNGNKSLKTAEFPERLKIVSKDLREIIIAPKATFTADGALLKSQGGTITIEKDGQLFSTEYVEVKLGKFAKLSKLTK